MVSNSVGGKILWWDDVSEPIEDLIGPLETMGLEVSLVSEVDSALKLCEEVAFDLIVIDIILAKREEPADDDLDAGLRLAGRIRNTAFNNTTPIVVYSRTTQDADRREKLEGLGTVGFADKFGTVDEIYQLILGRLGLTPAEGYDWMLRDPKVHGTDITEAIVKLDASDSDYVWITVPQLDVKQPFRYPLREALELCNDHNHSAISRLSPGEEVEVDCLVNLLARNQFEVDLNFMVPDDHYEPIPVGTTFGSLMMENESAGIEVL